MNFLFISPQFPPSFFHFCVELKMAGANVLAIGDAPYSEFNNELKASITEYSCLNMMNYESVYRTVGYFISKYGRIDRIDSHSEFWLGLEAKLREDFNIFGQKPKDLLINQSKLGMKKIFHNANVPCVEALPIDNPDLLNDFISRYGYPFIIKPDKGVGASNTYKVQNEHEMDMILSNLPPGYIIEPFIEGKIVTFDGLADRHGEIMFCASFELNDTVLEILQEKRDTYYYYSREMSPELEKFGRHVVKGFNVKERFFHCEFFRLNDGSFYAIEINVRPPGGFILDMQNYTSDIDLYKAWARLVVLNEDTFTYQRKYNVATVARRDHISYRYSKRNILDYCKEIIVEYKRMPPLFADAMGNDIFIIRHQEKDLMFSAIEMIMERA